MPSPVERVRNVLFGVDETVNAALGGSPRETISGTVGRAAQAGAPWAKWLAQPVVNLVMLNSKHCQQAAANEASRRIADKGLS